MNNILVYILFIFYPLGQFLRLNFDGVTILGNDFIVCGAIVFWLIKSFFKKEKIIISKTGKLILIFSLYLLFTLLINFLQFSFKEIFISFLYWVRWFFYALLFIFIYNQKAIKFHVVNLFIKAVTTISIIGLLQYFFFPDLRFMEEFFWDPHYYRLTAPFFDPAFTGAILVLGLILLIVFNFNKKINITDFISIVLIYVALVLTYSRASYLMFYFSILLISIFKKSFKFFTLASMIFLITYLVLPQQKSYGTNLQRKETVSARIKNWQNSIIVWQKKPIFGFGFNTYRFVQKKMNLITPEEEKSSHSGGGSDSSLLFIGATTGIVGLLFYLYLILNLLKNSFINRNNPASLAFLISIISLFVHSFFSNSLFYPFIMEWFWILAATQINKLINKNLFLKRLHA